MSYKSSSIIITLVIIVAVITLIYTPKYVNADDVFETDVDQLAITSLSITPSIYEEILTLGETSTNEFLLTNNSNIPLPIKSYIRVFEASDENGGVNIDDQPEYERLSPVSWIQIESPDFIIQPNTSRTVVVNFNPPSDLPPGGHYATIFFEPLVPESYLTSSSLSIGSRIGGLLFLIGPGDIITDASLIGGQTSKFVFFENKLFPEIKVVNNGNIHVRPRGNITYENVITGNIKEIEIREFTVLPTKTRIATLNNDEFLWPGIYKYSINIVYGNEKSKLSNNQVVYYLQLVYLIVIMLLAGVSVLLFWHKPRRRIIRTLSVVIKGK